VVVTIGTVLLCWWLPRHGARHPFVIAVALLAPMRSPFSVGQV
jgi:hypothetical protein